VCVTLWTARVDCCKIMWWNGRDTVTKQFESNLLEKHKTSLETKQENYWHGGRKQYGIRQPVQRQQCPYFRSLVMGACGWISLAGTSTLSFIQWLDVNGCVTKGIQHVLPLISRLYSTKSGVENWRHWTTFVCKMAVKTLRHFGPCGWTVQYFNSKCLYFGSGAKMSGHFRPIRTVPKCLSAELSRLWSVRLSSDWKWFSNTNYALWGSTTNGGSRLLKWGHMTETCKISHCILSSVLTTYSCDISIKWFTAFT